MVEPAWKMMLSTKALLVELRRLFPRHPNLLEAHYLDRDGNYPPFDRGCVLKPVHAREGANVTILQAGNLVAHTSGTYGGPMIAQARANNLFRTVEGHAVVGSWIVGDLASGVGLREDVGLITSNSARFVPHAIVG